MRINTKSHKSKMLLAIALLSSTLAAFAAPVKTLVLQQGALPTIDNEPIAGADIYTNTVDTYVDRLTPTTAYGDAEILEFFYHNMNSNDTQHAYIRFENFTEHLPPEAVIVGARLRLLGAGEGATGGKRGEIAIMTADWQTNMTWNSGRVETRIKSGHAGWDGVWASNTWASFDLTSVARAWQSGELGNYGFILRSMADSSYYKKRRAHSSKAPNVADRPIFEIDFMVPGKALENGRPIRWDIQLANGPAIMEDTVLIGPLGTTPVGLYCAENYASRDYADVRTYNDRNGQPQRVLLRLNLTHQAEAMHKALQMAPQRVLLRLNLTHPALRDIAASAEQEIGRPQLDSAWLDFFLLSCDRSIYLHIWRLDPEQDWDVNTATAETRDGVTPWIQPMTNQVIGNVIAPYIYRSEHEPILEAGTEHLHITEALQYYIDGTNNVGFVVGQSGDWKSPYEHRIGLTEQNNPFMRPMLVVVTKTPLQAGSVILIR